MLGKTTRRNPMKDDDLLLTPAEACALAGVGATTIKRWADAGVLTHVRTAGGHRRFPRAALLRFIGSQAHHDPSAPDDANPWIARLLGGRPQEVEGELLFARARLGSWHAVAEEVGVALVEVGERWRQGQLSILDEHILSERLSRALARIGDALPTAAEAPRALLACPEAEEHRLGLALAELCLRELGWITLWAGARTPLAEIEGVVAFLEVELLALSASAFVDDTQGLARVCDTLESACEARGIALALGGTGAWPTEPRRARRFRDFGSFHRFAAEIGTRNR